MTGRCRQGATDTRFPDSVALWFDLLQRRDQTDPGSVEQDVTCEDGGQINRTDNSAPRCPSKAETFQKVLNHGNEETVFSRKFMNVCSNVVDEQQVNGLKHHTA